MIENIGHRHVGIAKMARKAATVVAKYGEAAIFYRVDTKACAALSRTDPAWDSQMLKHQEHLVGVYAMDASAYRLAQWIEADMREHEREAA